MPSGERDRCPFPRTPFPACGRLPPLRSGLGFLDQAEHFPHNQKASVATLRIGVRDQPGMLFGFSPEWCSTSLRNAVRLRRNACSTSPESAIGVHDGAARHSRDCYGTWSQIAGPSPAVMGAKIRTDFTALLFGCRTYEYPTMCECGTLPRHPPALPVDQYAITVVLISVSFQSGHESLGRLKIRVFESGFQTFVLFVSR